MRETATRRRGAVTNRQATPPKASSRGVVPDIDLSRIGNVAAQWAVRARERAAKSRSNFQGE